jgi:hypothetical protein
MVCEGCRNWLPGLLRDVVDGYALLAEVDLVPDERLSVRMEWVTIDGHKVPRPMVDDQGELVMAPSDPVATGLPAGTVRSGSRGAPVTGSREAPVPVTLDLVDLTATARMPNPVRGPGYYPRSLWPEDQIGRLPVATILDQWVHDWISYDRCPGNHLPAPTVVTLAGWLTIRLGWACDEHPAVDDFAAELREVRAALNRLNGDGPLYPEPIVAVPCSGCDILALFCPVSSPYRAECGSCGKLYTDDEYARWTGLLAAMAKRRAAA